VDHYCSAFYNFTIGTLTKRWLHGPQVDEPLGFEVYSGTTAGGSGTAHEIFADRLGSVIEVVEAATGTVVSSQRFDSFGLRTATGPLLQRYGFTGREHDAESGLIYYRARAYDPAIGMFLQRDPIGFSAGDLNLYAYTWNDPYNLKDPSGHAVVADFTMLTAFTIGFAGTSCLVLEPCRDRMADAGRAVGDTARGIGGLFGALGRLIYRMADTLFNDSFPGDGEEDDRPDPRHNGGPELDDTPKKPEPEGPKRPIPPPYFPDKTDPNNNPDNWTPTTEAPQPPPIYPTPPTGETRGVKITIITVRLLRVVQGILGL
jgi:RHS repeat-associated protein